MMSSKTSLSAVMAKLVIVSLLCDAMPASAAAVVSTSAARRRRQLPESDDHPMVDEARQDGPAGSLLVRAWLRAAAARAAADRQHLYGDVDDNDGSKWKRQLDIADIYSERRRRRNDWNADNNDFLRRNSVSSS